MSHPEHGPLTECRAAEILEPCIKHADVGENDDSVFVPIPCDQDAEQFWNACEMGAAALRELASLRADLATCFDAAWHADGNFNNANCADCLAFGELAVKHGRARKDGGRFVFLEPNAAEEGK